MHSILYPVLLISPAVTPSEPCWGPGVGRGSDNRGSWSARRNDNECTMPNSPLVVHASYLVVKVLYWSNKNNCLCQTWPGATAGVLLVHFRCNIQSNQREKWNRVKKAGGDIIEAVASGEEKPQDKHRTAVCIKIFVKIYSERKL